MIKKKNFLRKPMLVKDFIDIGCLFFLAVCSIKLVTDANIFLIVFCVSAVTYFVLQIADALLQREDKKNEETWN